MDSESILDDTVTQVEIECLVLVHYVFQISSLRTTIEYS